MKPPAVLLLATLLVVPRGTPLAAPAARARGTEPGGCRSPAASAGEGRAGSAPMDCRGGPSPTGLPKTKRNPAAAALRPAALPASLDGPRLFDGAEERRAASLMVPVSAGPAPRGDAPLPQAANARAKDANAPARAVETLSAARLGDPGVALNGKSRLGVRAFNAALSVLSALDLELVPRETRPAQVRRGYSPLVASADVGGSHSIGDLKKYLSSGIPPAVARDVIGNGRTVEVHKCVDLEGLHSLAARGFTDAALVAKPLRTGGGGAGGALLFRAASPATGEVRYALTNVLGDDLATHNELQLKLSGVPSENVLVFDHHPDLGPIIDQALAKAGAVPRKAVIGYAGHFKQDLSKRGVYSAKHRTLTGRLGAAPLSRLLERLESVPEAARTLRARPDLQGLLASPSDLIFRKWEQTLKMEELDGLLADSARRDPSLESLRVDLSRFRAGKNVQDLFLPGQRFTLLGEDGREEPVLVTKFLYGDLSGRIAERLLAAGVDDLTHLGNAGGLSSDAAIGQLHVPRRIHDPRGGVANDGVPNAMLEFLSAKGAAAGEPRLRLGTEHATTPSALLETDAYIDALKQGGLDAIEIEAAWVARAVQEANARGGSVRLATAILISDLPGADDGGTIENMQANEKSRDYGDSFHFFVDALLERWKSRGVAISEGKDSYLPEGASVNSRLPSPLRALRDVARILSRRHSIERKKSAEELVDVLAGRLLEDKGLGADGHVLMKENVATYLFNALPRDELRRLAQPGGGLPEVLAAVRGSRWSLKLKRDLERPYTDQEVVAHLRELEVDLEKRLADMASAESPPAKVYLTGSVVRGRFGARSDLDMLVDVEDPAARDALRTAVELQFRTGRDEGAMLFPLSADKARTKFKLFAMGSKLDLGTGRSVLEQEDRLLEPFTDALARRGISLDFGPDGGVRVSARKDVPRKMEMSLRWIDDATRAYKKALHAPRMLHETGPGVRVRLVDALQKGVGSLFLVPGLGRGLEAVVSRLLFPASYGEAPAEPAP